MKRAALLGIWALAACGADAQESVRQRTSDVLPAEVQEWTTELLSAPAWAAHSRRPRDEADLDGRVVCEVEGAHALPEEIRESSGLARGRSNTALFWTHNDAGNTPDLFALDAEGNLVDRVRLEGATSTDWEDIESGPCPAGDCLYVADIGNNGGEREFVTIFQVPEPSEPLERATPAAAISVRFPDGRWDAEALFVLPDGSTFIVTKGRSGPVTLYAVPPDVSGSEAGVLRRVRDLLPAPANEQDRVTAATATPDGRWVALRTYRALLLYPAGRLVAGEPIEPTSVDLSRLGHPQGEALAMSNDGTVWLTSESERGGTPAVWSRLRCDLPEG